MMVRTASISLLALFVSVFGRLLDVGSPPAVLHLAFAVGILPLIFAAMLHFIPVLTQTGDPGRGLHRLPGIAQLTGLLVVAALAGGLPYGVLGVAAAVDLVLAVILLRWMLGRARATLGRPHPCWRWYALALCGLMLALLAAASLSIGPALWRDLRHAHLHLNTLALVGLAAFGTLPVLLPTALGRADPQAAAWLRRWPLPFFAAALMIAGSGRWPGLALLGGLVLLSAVLQLLWQWWRTFGGRTLLSDGAAASLAIAAAGFAGQLLCGMLHGFGVLPAAPGVAAWGAGFLLPLVTGALTHLLPVWRWPGPVTPVRRELRAALARYGALRAGCWGLAGLLLAVELYPLAQAFVLAGCVLFASRVLGALRFLRSTR